MLVMTLLRMSVMAGKKSSHWSSLGLFIFLPCQD